MPESSPLDFLKPSTQYLSHEKAAERMAICRSCPEYRIKTCGICKCFMPAKTRLAHAECPAGKWGSVEPTP